MVPISACVGRYWRRHSASLAAGCTLLLATAHAAAAQAVIVTSASPDLEPLTGRLCAELASAGYSVSMRVSDSAPRCERGSGAASVTLTLSSADPEAAVARVCLDGATIEVAGSRSRAAQLAVSTAEALNGLLATAPPVTHPRRPPVSVPSAPARPARTYGGVTIGQTLILDLGDFPLLWGVSLEGELPLGSRTAFSLGGFLPISRAELSSEQAELRAAMAFVRAGLVARYSFGQVSLSGSMAVGPAVTWVSADAVAPYVGGRASTLGVLAAVGWQATYPARGPAFALAGARASVMQPSPRFVVPNAERRDLGPLLAELSIGVGLRL